MAIYFVEHVESGAIKIGWTEIGVVRRLRAVLVDYGLTGQQFKVLGETTGGRETEDDIHRMFAEERLPLNVGGPSRGAEWFQRSDRLMSFIASLPATANVGRLVPRAPRQKKSAKPLAFTPPRAEEG